MTNCFIYDWSTEILNDELVIRIFGLMPDSKSCCITIRNYQPYIYLELPTSIPWNDGKVKMLMNAFKKYPPVFSTAPEYYRKVKRKKLYYARIDPHTMEPLTFPFLLMKFKTNKDFHFLNNKFAKPISVPGIGNVKLQVHENNISPIQQISSIQGIPLAGWIQFTGVPVEAEYMDTCCDYEFTASYKSLSPTDFVANIQPSVMSFDIETNSSNPKVIPSPKNPTDCIFQISCICWKKDKYQKYLLSLGNPDPIVVGDDVLLFTFEHEWQLIESFGKLVQLWNPNAFTGYNIFGFDLPYLVDRASFCHIKKTFSKLGMIRGKECRDYSPTKGLNEKDRYMETAGRIWIDLLHLMKRDYKFANNRLDTVAKFFLNASKDPITHLDIFYSYREGVVAQTVEGIEMLGKVGKYCIIDSVLVQQMFDKLDVWTGLMEMASVCRVLPSIVFIQGQQSKVFSQVYNYCYMNRVVVENMKNAITPELDYKGATVIEPEPGIYNNVISHDFCLAGDTMISLANGTSRPLESLCNESIMGLVGDGFGVFPIIYGLQKKGERETVKIYLQDGTSIVSTPDHKFMKDSGEWVRADELKGQYVKCGIEYPRDMVGEDEIGWELVFREKILNMSEHRSVILAIARMSGYMLVDGSIEKAVFETRYDAEQFMTDVKLVCGTRTTICRNDGTFCITLPFPFVDSIAFPNMVSERNCPYAVIREFIGGTSHIAYDALDSAFSKFEIESGVETDPAVVFARTIGFRYSINKTYRMAVQSSYLTLVDPKPFRDYLIELGVSNWFTSYAVAPDDSTIPCFRKRVLDVCPNGIHPVFDIEVRDAHNFIANGVVAHNCSLYPSIMIAYNIDYSTLVPDDMKIEDDKCHVVEWHEHEFCEHTSNFNLKSKDYRCNKFYYRFLREPKGILPSIAENLLDMRKQTRSQMKKLNAELPTMSPQEQIDAKQFISVLDKRQLSYKISCNSIYGTLGATHGYLPFMAGASSITALGRRNLIKASDYLQTTYGTKTIYGDSVSGDTPMCCSVAGLVRFFTIDEISDGHWIPYHDKEVSAVRDNIKVWTEQGFTVIKKVIRHKTRKQLFRVLTHTGCVDVTEDHSLLTVRGEKISPRELRIGSKILHSEFPVRRLWDEETDFDSNLNRVPHCVLNGSSQLKQDFLETYGNYVDSSSKIFSAELFYLADTIGYNAMVEDCSDTYRTTFSCIKWDDHRIKKICPLPLTNDYVYDVETENRHFSAGIGKIIVHNTDSVYSQVPHIVDQQELMRYGERIEREMVEKNIFPSPMKLEYEESVYADFLILTKKRYMWKEFDEKTNTVLPEIGKKGVLLARRDNAKFVRDIYEQVVNLLFDKKSVVFILAYIHEYVMKCFTRQYPQSNFVITKSVNAEDGYKKRDLPEDEKKRQKRLAHLRCDEDGYNKFRSLPAHVQLAIIMRSRGIRVDVGQRLEYVVVESVDGSSDCLFDKIEDKDYQAQYAFIIPIDYLYYIKALIVPLDQLLVVVFKKDKLFTKQYKVFVNYAKVRKQLKSLTQSKINLIE